MRIIFKEKQLLVVDLFTYFDKVDSNYKFEQLQQLTNCL